MVAHRYWFDTPGGYRAVVRDPPLPGSYPCGKPPRSSLGAVTLRLLSLAVAPTAYAHASRIAASDEDWLTESHTSLPFDPSTDNYVTMKYRVT